MSGKETTLSKFSTFLQVATIVGGLISGSVVLAWAGGGFVGSQSVTDVRQDDDIKKLQVIVDERAAFFPRLEVLMTSLVDREKESRALTEKVAVRLEAVSVDIHKALQATAVNEATMKALERRIELQEGRK